MRVKILTVMLAAFALCFVASAQGYSIRLTYNTNLRENNSLQATIVETAPSGTTLQVISELNRWLRINRNGREVWMASWVSHTRVESDTQTQTSTQTTSNIDNCCFVDRQCASDEEWTNGYWAFQNNQCTAPSTSQTQTTTQTTSTVSSQIDNCCFVDRQCNSDEDWLNGFYAFQNNQCTAPTGSQTQTSSQPTTTGPALIDNCCFAGWQCNTDDDWLRGFNAFQTNQCKHPGMALEGSPGFVLQMEQSLDMLKNRVPHWYDYTIRGLDRIVQDLSNDIPGVYVEGRTFRLDYTDHPPAGYSFDAHTTHNAGMLVHEACHVHRYEAWVGIRGLSR